MGKRYLAGFPRASPEDVGMSPKPLRDVRSGTQLEVRELASCAGVCHLILRRGQCVLLHADGWANREKEIPFTMSTVCRLHGATKALVSAACLRLVDQGKVKLDDCISKYINFSDRVSMGGKKSRPAKVKPTIRHLLTMTAGLRDTDCPAYAAIKADVQCGKIKDLEAYCDALAKIPLQSEPGTWYEYGLSTDFIGRICEVVCGENLERFMRKQILEPLGMKDTHFQLPEKKRSRVAVLYQCKETPTSKRRRIGTKYTPIAWDHPDSAPGIMSPAGGALSYKDPGMWSTARDYARFCQMLLDGGRALDGKRVLSVGMVRAIWTEGLAPFANKHGRVANWNVDDTDGPPWEGGSWDKCSWSLISTLTQLNGPLRPSARSGRPRQGHAMGVGGGGGVYWLVDKKRQLVALSFQQSFDGGRPEDDGLGPPGADCTDLAVAAVDQGSA